MTGGSLRRYQRLCSDTRFGFHLSVCGNLCVDLKSFESV